MDETKLKNSDPSEVTTYSFGAYLAELGRFLLVALVIIVPLRLFIAEPFIVSGCSMFPTFNNKEYLIVDKISYHQRTPQRGEVIVFKYPKDEQQYFIKRIIGLPGETVNIEQGGVVVSSQESPNGVRLKENYLPNQTQTFGRTEPLTLGSDEYFVLGDNRTASSDSRVWGVLPKHDIVGRVVLRVLPVNRFTLFSTQTLDQLVPAQFFTSSYCKI